MSERDIDRRYDIHDDEVCLRAPMPTEVALCVNQILIDSKTTLTLLGNAPAAWHIRVHVNTITPPSHCFLYCVFCLLTTLSNHSCVIATSTSKSCCDFCSITTDSSVFLQTPLPRFNHASSTRASSEILLQASHKTMKRLGILDLLISQDH